MGQKYFLIKSVVYYTASCSSLESCIELKILSSASLCQSYSLIQALQLISWFHYLNKLSNSIYYWKVAFYPYFPNKNYSTWVIVLDYTVEKATLSALSFLQIYMHLIEN